MEMFVPALLLINVVLLAVIAVALNKLVSAFSLSVRSPPWATNDDGVLQEIPRSHDAKTIGDKIEFIACGVRVINQYAQRDEERPGAERT